MVGFLKEVTEKGLIRKTSTVIPFGSMENIPAESEIVKKLLQNENEDDDDQDFNRDGVDGKNDVIESVLFLLYVAYDVCTCVRYRLC